MEFFVKSGNPEKQKTGCLIVGVFESRKLSTAAQQIDDISEGYINSIVKRGDMEGKFGQTLLLHSVPGTSCDRVLLVGCGKEREFDAIKYKDICGKVIKLINETGATDAISTLPLLNVKGQELYSKVRFAVEAANNSLYLFEQLKSEKSETRRPLRKMTLFIESRADLAESENAIRHAQGITAGQSLTRDLANLPGNICNPTFLAETAEQLSKDYSAITTNIIDEAELKEMGAGAFVSVSQGSDQPGKLICMEYNGGEKGDKPIVFVGKGITFDTGGISLKPGAKMDEMKFDMGGAASVFGAMKSVAEMGLPINVVGVVAAAENMPSGKASRPGDVVTSLSGQTIEILNTDAEGRLVLCDALTYVDKYDPEIVIDIATLTGAVIVALGHEASGVMSNNNSLANEIETASDMATDRVWRLPLWDEYHQQLKSNVADFTNLGGMPAGTITAGCFLSKFTKKYRWAHIDIAGTAWKSGAEKGATGRPVPLLSQIMLNRVK
ncbi:leucyl aminopeptidase [Kangiella sediminilitoris]|uniref:Probable cytosol aminopeptidase n=1 Tax=Kangiella sediminilitoris TaxID=1144748 RepID=A0A1B3BBV8_9GAMM|nr:leucyl aminopeptidase [Kangiella sediminilitoris]AOE50278.1 multifunctional aminopeptidase A [Kangiella sediminilitoris]